VDSSAHSSYHSGGRVSLQEGALCIGDLVFWRVISHPTVRRFTRGVSYHPIYILALGFSDSEVIFLEAKFPWGSTARKWSTLLEEGNTYNEGSWISYVFSLEDS
jgi:hypothetical protein